MSYIMVDIESEGNIPRNHAANPFGAVLVAKQLDNIFSGKLKSLKFFLFLFIIHTAPIFAQQELLVDSVWVANRVEFDLLTKGESQYVASMKKEGKKVYIALICLFFLYFLCGWGYVFSQEYAYHPNEFGILEPENHNILFRQCSRGVPRKMKRFFKVQKDQIEILEKNFRRIGLTQASLCCFMGGTIDEVEGYYYQYLGVMIKKKKYIYVNAIRKSVYNKAIEELNDWLNHPIVYCDGGVSFWGALFSIDREEFTELAINGI